MIPVGGSQIECGKDPYIIAEVGSNWKSWDDAYASVQAAKEAGANAVKFQLFDHKSLYGLAKDKKSAYDDSYDLPLEWVPKLRQRADQCGIDFMCTVFNPEHVRVINPYVYAHKVASSDINHISLLREIDQMGKPVFMSTGAASVVEIEMAVALIHCPLALLYCVASYPATTVDLTLIDTLKGYTPHVGYSDHTVDAVYIPYAAVKFHQACIIEKHFTAIAAATPDSEHSLTPAKFKLMVDRIRGNRRGLLGPSPDEYDMLVRHKRRLVATADIKRGEPLKFEKNFGAYRSLAVDSKGLSPLALAEVNGKAASKDIEMGSVIAVGDFS